VSDEYLMTGSLGLDVDGWQGGFYDEDLPPDWRAASYSTLLRSVILTEQEWQKAVAHNWIEEVDDEFRFVFLAEVQQADDLSRLSKNLEALPEGLAAQLAGVVLKIEPELAKGLDPSAFKALAQMYPLCLDIGMVAYAAAGIDVYCERAGVAAVWYPAAQPEPLPTGDFLVALIDQETLPEQKGIVSQIDKWMNGQRLAGLFNTNNKDAPIRAQETRILAELMGV
jgi:hypothetical protein